MDKRIKTNRIISTCGGCHSLGSTSCDYQGHKHFFGYKRVGEHIQINLEHLDDGLKARQFGMVVSPKTNVVT